MREQDVYTSDFVSSKSEMGFRFLAAFIAIFSPKTEKYLQLGASNHKTIVAANLLKIS